MARKVKCVDTGEYSTSDVAYRATNGKYWSSVAAYNHHQDQMEWFHKCVNLIMGELGYDENFIPTLIMKNLKRYEKVGYDVAYDTINHVHDSIVWALQNKTFIKEFNKITYVFRIIDNHVLDVYEERKRDREQKRINDGMIVPQNDEINNRKQETHDISRFLAED